MENMTDGKHTAKFVRRLDGWKGDARLYQLDPALPDGGHRYVIVSAAIVSLTGPETYIFPASESGEPIDMLELNGSFRGELDHAQALRNAGYDVDESVNPAAMSARIEAMRHDFLCADERGLGPLSTQHFLLALSALDAAQRQMDIAGIHLAAELATRRITNGE